jgi:light-regulated signal transduction histidine kinase (bacteriophytochrome)
MAETLRTNILARQDAQALLAEQAQELKRAHDELLQLVFVSSHDLQTPIRAVVSYAQLLARRYRNKLDAKGTEYLHYAVDGMLRMQELVNDLLVYLQIRAGDREPQPTDCNAVFQDAMSRLLLDVERLQARVTCDLLPVVAADRTQITALFAHLLDNALKFRRDVPPEVHVSATKRRGEWLFSVSDNGIGIESAMYERIFGIFQRLHPPDRYPGTGIGLALAKRIVERHGGRIWLDSTPGVGTTFYFTLLERPSWTEPTGVNGALPTIGKGTFEHG